MNKTKVLLVDDEKYIVELLKFNLEVKGFEVSYAYDGLEGFNKAKEIKPNIILLDWMLPVTNGLDVLKMIRIDKDLDSTPIIMLTAKNMESDKIEGLEFGADDYITKPFSVKELIARMNSVLRRYATTHSGFKQDVLVVGDIELDLDKHQVKKNTTKIELTLKEFELLKLLIQNKGKVLSRDYLLDKIWGYEYYGETRTVDVHIRHLRKKIEDDDNSGKYIETIRGVGYKLD